MSNRRQNPSPAEKNKWLEGTSCFCLSVLPVSPGRGFMARTVCVCVGGGVKLERRMREWGLKMRKMKNVERKMDTERTKGYKKNQVQPRYD